MTHIAGSLLLRAGLIAPEHLVSAETMRQRDGGTFGECLVRMGVVSEEQLVDFYHRRLLVPRIAPAQFERVSPRAVAALPADMAAEFRVFPVEIDSEGTITLAMADPANTHVIDELTFFTDRFLQRAVAAESVIKRAIERYYGVRFEAPRAAAPPPRAAAEKAPAMGEPEEVVLLTASAIVAFPPVSEPVVLLRPEAIVRQPSPAPASAKAALAKEAPPAAAAKGVTAPVEPEAVVLLTKVKRADTPLPPTVTAERDRAPAQVRVAPEPSVPVPASAAPAGLPLARLPSTRTTLPMPPLAAGPALPGLTLGQPVPATGERHGDGDPLERIAALCDPAAEPILLTRPKGPTRKRSITLAGFGLSSAANPPLVELREARSREAIGAILLDYVHTMAPRVALFQVRKGQLAGHDARGADLEASTVRRLYLDTDGASLFSDVIRSRLPYRGPMPDSPANRAFANIIGERKGEVLLLPIALRERVIAVVYADGINAPLPDAALHAISREAGRAYERLILQARR